ncbi:M23 family metallopeptidase [Fulvivirga sediminis]|uniref:M23 family metallopeptidase n=1 Tax=Fulvivirga sediminis TaxID=2803949 RepID=A0A937F8S4_9BACT|nr:M23 family metallopeptidase [Fulvivirga sediminis]MBL3658416.1 M23 family metallopeptidase [Fulvivirga sediminis]
MANTACSQSGQKEQLINRYKSMEMDKRPVYFPLPQKSFIRISSGFGVRKHPILKVDKFHPGLDMVAKKGTPIYASANGKVIRASFSPTYGNVVVIDHNEGYKTLYAHMTAFKVKKDQEVKQGTIIGYVGSTGRSTGPHLHFEILLKDKKIDPFKYWTLIMDRWK